MDRAMLCGEAHDVASITASLRARCLAVPHCTRSLHVLCCLAAPSQRLENWQYSRRSVVPGSGRGKQTVGSGSPVESNQQPGHRRLQVESTQPPVASHLWPAVCGQPRRLWPAATATSDQLSSHWLGCIRHEAESGSGQHIAGTCGIARAGGWRRRNKAFCWWVVRQKRDGQGTGWAG